MIPTTHAGIEAAVDRHELLLAYTPSHLNAVKGQALSASDLRFLLEARVMLEKSLHNLLGQFDQAHTALDVERSPSAKVAIQDARTALRLTSPTPEGVQP